MTPQAADNFDDDASLRWAPPAADNFDDSVPLRWWTTTAVDLISPFDQGQDDLTTSHDLHVAIDAPTTFLQRPRFQGLPPGTIVGESYEIGERLGAGSMGEVYAARHVGLGKHVAIKVIGTRLSEDDRAIARFVTEARTLAKIQHPAIVTVEHVGELPDGRAYFVMEHLHGESLSVRISRGRIPFREALRTLDQIARGLAAAHVSGVIHRDLKPDNTFMVHHTGEPPTVKLLDFGLAKLASTHALPTSTHALPTSTHALLPDESSDNGLVFGTPLYMSPEQTRGFHIDHRSDIYALGCVAYELVLGGRPFPQAQTTTAICAAHLHEVPLLPRALWPAIPPQLDRLLFAMLAKDPDHRPTLAQVRAIVTTLLTAAPPPQAATMLVGKRRPKKTAARARTVLAAVGILAAGALLGGAVSSTLRARNANMQTLPLHHTPGY